jgi:UDP-N-acetylglucosamine--dolichyl-phosphate N-acetylglucosaminephosphotransferase
LEEKIIAAIAASAIAFFSVYALTPILIKFLEKRNMTVKDVGKQGNVQVARPGGISIVIGLVASEIILYVFFPMSEILAVIIVSILGFTVGIIDDKKVMGGWFKPVALAFCAAPILLLGAYDSNLDFPLFGSVSIPFLYMGLIVCMIPIAGNTINSIDVLNGVASGFITIASFALTISLIILQNYEIAIATLCLAFASLAFYKYHKLPSRIFPGDSGALTFGATYGVIAIVGHVEVIAAIAILPAIINSFLFLSSVKKITEHRETKNHVSHTDDFKLKTGDYKNAPPTKIKIHMENRNP